MNRFKKFITVITLAILLSCSLFAANEWYVGKTITAFEYTGLQNVSSKTIDALLDEYVGVEYSDSVFNDISNLLYSQEWMEWFIAEAEAEGEERNLVINFEIHEAPYISKVVFDGNEKLRDSALLELQNIKVGGFFNYSILSANAALIEDEYLSKGYRDAIVNVS